MRLAANVFRMLVDATRYAISTRRVSVLAVLALGFVLVALVITTQFVAPLAVYPFV